MTGPLPALVDFRISPRNSQRPTLHREEPANIEDLGLQRRHRTLTVLRKGGKVVTMPMAARTARAVDLAVGERTEGPLFMNHDGTRRLDRHAASRVVRRLAKQAGTDKRIGPHSLRHSFITAALDAGVALRRPRGRVARGSENDHALRRARGSLDRHATYIVATCVAGASR